MQLIVKTKTKTHTFNNFEGIIANQERDEVVIFTKAELGVKEHRVRLSNIIDATFKPKG